EHLEFRGGGEDRRRTAPVGDVELAVDVDHGAPRAARGTLVVLALPDLVPGLELEAVGPAVLFHHIEMLADDDAGADPLGVLRMVPEAALRDVAPAPHPDPPRGGPPARPRQRAG